MAALKEQTWTPPKFRIHPLGTLNDSCRLLLRCLMKCFTLYFSIVSLTSSSFCSQFVRSSVCADRHHKTVSNVFSLNMVFRVAPTGAAEANLFLYSNLRPILNYLAR